MNSLIVGNTSQLSYYFPKEYERISSRDVLNASLCDNFYDRIYLCFAEQRTFLDDMDMFIDVNVHYTIKVIEYFESKCNKLIVYGTSELWNNYEGGISIDTPISFVTSEKLAYVYSKYVMIRSICMAQDRGTMKNVIILHPFNFNSIYRKQGFLFYSIFDSIINKKGVEIGDTYMYRDMIHPKYVAQRSMLADKDEIIGSGRLTFVHDFIKDLYYFSDLNYKDYVVENFNLNVKRKIQYLQSSVQLYSELLCDTLNDIKGRCEL